MAASSSVTASPWTVRPPEAPVKGYVPKYEPLLPATVPSFNSLGNFMNYFNEAFQNAKVPNIGSTGLGMYGSTGSASGVGGTGASYSGTARPTYQTPAVPGGMTDAYQVNQYNVNPTAGQGTYSSKQLSDLSRILRQNLNNPTGSYQFTSGMEHLAGAERAARESYEDTNANPRNVGTANAGLRSLNRDLASQRAIMGADAARQAIEDAVNRSMALETLLGSQYEAGKGRELQLEGMNAQNRLAYEQLREKGYSDAAARKLAQYQTETGAATARYGTEAGMYGTDVDSLMRKYGIDVSSSDTAKALAQKAYEDAQNRSLENARLQLSASQTGGGNQGGLLGSYLQAMQFQNAQDQTAFNANQQNQQGYRDRMNAYLQQGFTAQQAYDQAMKDYEWNQRLYNYRTNPTELPVTPPNWEQQVRQKYGAGLTR